MFTAVNLRTGLGIKVVASKVLRWNGEQWVPFKRLKDGLTEEDFLKKLEANPDWEFDVEPPTFRQLELWVMNEVAEATDGCRVELDGHCPHGYPAWTLVYGMI